MINFDNQLTFVEISYLKTNENVDWKTLRLIEHIFEAKLFFGNESVFSLILLGHRSWKPYCLELLENFFDKVIYGSIIDNVNNVRAAPKISNFELWNLEREFNRSRYKKFSEMDLEQFRYRPISARELEADFYHRLLRLNLYPLRNYPVRNLKNYYLKRAMDLKFYFDFFVERRRDKLVEIKSFKKMNNFLIQNLLIKSRLIRYQKIDGGIKQVRPLYKMILLVNGDISGPEYDQMRYLRMLTGAGWDVYPMNILESEERLREVFFSD